MKDTWLEFTIIDTKQNVLINVSSIDEIEETDVEGVAATDIFANGNRVTVSDSYSEVKSMIERIIRGY